MGESSVKWANVMPKAQAIDPRMTADEMFNFICEKVTLQHSYDAQH